MKPLTRRQIFGYTVGGIAALFNLVPAGFSILCQLTLLFYPITASLFQRITHELAQRESTPTEPC